MIVLLDVIFYFLEIFFDNGLGLSTSLQSHMDKSVKSHISQKSLSHKTNNSYDTWKRKTKTLPLWFFSSLNPSLALYPLFFFFVVLLLRSRFILRRSSARSLSSSLSSTLLRPSWCYFYSVTVIQLSGVRLLGATSKPLLLITCNFLFFENIFG